MRRFKSVFRSHRLKTVHPQVAVEAIGIIERPTSQNATNHCVVSKLSDQRPTNEIGDSEIVILVVGVAGSGKSTLIHQIRGRKTPKTDYQPDSKPLAHEIQVFPWIYQTRNIRFVELPGFDSRILSNVKIFKQIAIFLQELYERKIPISAILYCHPFTVTESIRTSILQLEFVKALIGQASFKNLIFVLTYPDKIPNENQRINIVSGLEKDYWSEFKAHGARISTRSGGDPLEKSALGSITTSHDNTILELQRELVDQERTLLRTSAGKVIQTAIEEVKVGLLDEVMEIRDGRVRYMAPSTFQRDGEEERRTADIRELTAASLSLNWPVSKLKV